MQRSDVYKYSLLLSVGIIGITLILGASYYFGVEGGCFITESKPIDTLGCITTEAKREFGFRGLPERRRFPKF